MNKFIVLMMCVNFFSCSESKLVTNDNNFLKDIKNMVTHEVEIWNSLKQSVVAAGTNTYSRNMDGSVNYTQAQAESMTVYTLPLYIFDDEAFETDTTCYDVMKYCTLREDHQLFIGKKDNKLVTLVEAEKREGEWRVNKCLMNGSSFEKNMEWLTVELEKKDSHQYKLISISGQYFIVIISHREQTYYRITGEETDILDYVTFIIQAKKDGEALRKSLGI